MASGTVGTICAEGGTGEGWPCVCICVVCVCVRAVRRVSVCCVVCVHVVCACVVSQPISILSFWCIHYKQQMFSPFTLSLLSPLPTHFFHGFSKAQTQSVPQTQTSSNNHLVVPVWPVCVLAGPM